MMPRVADERLPDAPVPPEVTRRSERLAGFIYGTIVVLSVIVAGARAYPHGPAHVAALAAVTSFVFWLAHVYAHSVAHSLAHAEHLSFAELYEVGRREGAILAAAVPPIAFLALGHFGVVSPSTSFWLALVAGLIVLAVQGVAFARIEHLGLLATVVVVVVNVGMGLLLIGLKVLVTHL
jgi:hypothetical protein